MSCRIRFQGYWQGTGSVATAVILSDFWVEARDDTLVFCWDTATEVDMLGFNVRRSDPGVWFVLRTVREQARRHARAAST